MTAAGLRVALMIETGGPGGAERMLLQLAEELRDRGHEVCAVGPAERNPWLRTQFRERGFDPELYRMSRQLDPGTVGQLVRILRRRRIDVVHSHEFTMAVYGAAASLLARRPHVITMHGGRYYAGRLRRRVASRWAVQRSKAVVAVSATVAAELARTLRIRPHRVTVIHNGVRPCVGDGVRARRELGISEDEQLILAVGNLYPVKGHIVLLRALASISEDATLPRWRLAVAGRGGEHDILRSFADARGIGGRVHLLGFRADVPDLLAASDLYVMPSLSEGLPLGLLEAMSAGKAIVASRVGGIPEAVTSGRDALLVPPKDPDALAAAVRAVLLDPELRSRLGAAAAQRAQDVFSVRRMTEEYERLYRAVCGRSRQNR